jgi:hypothetical protein
MEERPTTWPPEFYKVSFSTYGKPQLTKAFACDALLNKQHRNQWRTPDATVCTLLL